MMQRLFSRWSSHRTSSKHHAGTGKGGVSRFHHWRPIDLPLNRVESGICGKRPRGSSTWRTRRSTIISCGSAIGIECQALSQHQRPQPPLEGGRPRSGTGHLLCPASFRVLPSPLAAGDLIEINSRLSVRNGGRHHRCTVPRDVMPRGWSSFRLLG